MPFGTSPTTIPTFYVLYLVFLGRIREARATRNDAQQHQQQEDDSTGQLAPNAAEEHDRVEYDGGVLDEGAQSRCSPAGRGE